jgi:hypothetical protein
MRVFCSYKGSVNVVLCDLACKDENARLRLVPLNPYFLINNVEDIIAFLGLTVFNSDKPFMFPAVEMRKSLLERTHN